MTKTRILPIPVATVTHHARGRRAGLTGRLQAAFGAFLSPDRLLPASNDNRHLRRVREQGGSPTDPLALPPDWQSQANNPADLLSLSLLPYDR